MSSKLEKQAIKEDKLAVYWQGELVGYLRDAKVDMFHLYGKWIPVDEDAGKRFMAALASAFQAWDEKMAGVEVSVGQSICGEVTSLDGDDINILMAFGH